NNQREFHAASSLLTKKYPDGLGSHYFGAIAAALDENWILAEKEIKRAEKLGLSHESAQKFLDSGVRSGALRSRIISDSLLTVALWAGGLALLFGLGYFLSKLTLRQVEQTDPLATVS